jgi:LacI family transcriptional regulator
MSTRVNIKDVARAAGVSIATVSRAFDPAGEVSAATRSRVLAAAERLGYRPDAAARTLVGGRSRLVAAFLTRCAGDPGREQPFARMVLAGLGDRLRAADHDMLVFEGADDVAVVCEQRRPDGAVFVCVAPWLVPEEVPVPAVGIDTGAATGCRVSVQADHAGGVGQAVGLLARLGHARIAFLGGSPGTAAGDERRGGYLAAMAAHGLALPPGHVHEGDFYSASGRAAAAALLAEDPPPTAFVAASDHLAAGALEAIAAAGLRVPDDVSVVGFDDLPWAALGPIGLTTIRQDPLAIGARAAEELLAAIDGGPPRTVTVPVELIVRGSTGHAPAVAVSAG